METNADDSTATQRRKPVIPIRNVLLIVVVLCGALAVVATGSAIIRRSASRQPYRLVIEPDDGHSVVHFAQPGRALMSRGFRVDVHVEKRMNLVLDSSSTAIPEGRVEFADTTILPGRFKVRIGQSLFDVMERGLEVDGSSSGWLDTNSW